MSEQDRSGDSANTSCFVGREEINSFTGISNLSDCWLRERHSGCGHTWLHSGKGLSSRIDRIYVPIEFGTRQSSVMSFPFSDHEVLKVEVEIPIVSVRGKGYWKFNVSILTDVLFIDDFRSHYRLWRTLIPGFDSLAAWWEVVKERIKSLCIFHGVRQAREKRSVLRGVQSRCLFGDKESVSRLLAEERRGAFVRSREKVLEEGESSGNFFVIKERSCAEGKVIKEVRDSGGRVVQGEDVVGVFHEFYSNLYSVVEDNESEAQDIFLDCIHAEVADADRFRLDQPLTLWKLSLQLTVWRTISRQSIDGLPCEFYKCFFDILGLDLLELFNEIFSHGFLCNSQRTAVVTLLPKMGDPLDPANRRPISLLTVDYKIISKVLQKRISTVFSVVNDFQTCSVPGRSIHQNLFVIRDVIDYVNLKGNSCALISLDQHKAFDKVDWTFLLKVLRKMNFGEYFCKWISILYTNICSRIMINGRLSGDVFIKRGVRQGCPLSPSLYVLFIEPLARYISSFRDIRGLSLPGSSGKTVKFLQYADDATCVASCHGDVKGFFNTIDLFRRATGACINLSKTCGLKLGGFVGRKLPANINWSETAIKITGIVFGTPNSIYSNWSKKVEKMELLINMWKGRVLTLLGKVLLINGVVYPLFYFLAAVFPVPEVVVKKVLKASFSFLWSGKTELVSRKVVMLDKREGGLGLENFKLKLNAMLVRPVLSILTDDPLLCSAYLVRYFISKRLRRFQPELWSNSRPNSDQCTPSLALACDVIEYLFRNVSHFVLDVFL
ncbi:reverse transcriptase [Apostichopus japonicus]|uniref:Reverse transcriptase n=1 Tax=Stichopus japonicus TaxID=307972 RepID=A0A2G8KBP6_STIJA|nr:reverse transcriptase [Apostichopus japonicus]